MKNNIEKPLISVVIPVYNVEKQLEQCLVSVIFNSYKNLEIIIVDDGTPDNSAAIYNKYAELDKRIKIIVQENAGLSAARNAGIEAASGEYINFVDSDDYIDLNYYEELINDALQYDADIVASGVKMSNTVVTIEYSHRIICADLYTKIQKLLCFKHGYAVRYLLRRKLLIENEIEFVVGKVFEDLPFTLTAVKAANRVVINPNVFYHYIRRPGTISTSKNRSKLRKWAYDFRANFLKENNLPQTLLQEPRIEYKILLFGLIPIGKKIVKSGGSKISYKIFEIPFFKTRRKLYE
ncbi:MAG: glycosyltransferase [Dysgonamonadaceae bacterium]|jgi:glycosyltransferase involved in cell wall biosynthesis|nr:glycosyltransferase [Dysgonamonadaceae bacterium]